jgi:hypothetical protein
MKFDALQFVPTEFHTAEDKAKFANQFVKLVESDFSKNMFPKWFYTQLSMTFGHIAHYNQMGFYDEFFRDTKGKIDFLKITIYYPYSGDAAYTYSDVERVLAHWVLGERITEKYEGLLNREVELFERGELHRLKSKYEKSNV